MNKDINNNKQLEIIHKEDDEQSDDKESDPVDINDDDEDQDDNKNSGMEQEKEQQANKIKRKKEKVDEKSQKRREKEVGYLQAADAFRKMVDSGIEKQRMKNKAERISQILSTQQGVDDITSFTKDLEDQTIDLVNDDLLNQKRKLIQHSIDSGVGLKTRITADGRNVILPGQKKWDRKKMKFVNADGPKKNALLEQARLQRLGNGDIQNIKKTQQHMDQHQLNKVLNRNSRRGQNVDEGPRYRAKGYTTSLYDEWKKKTKRSIPSVGEIEDEDTVTARSDLQNGGQTKNRMFNHHKKKGRINQNKKGNVKEARKQNQSKSFDKQMNDPQKIKIDKHSAKKAPKPTKQKARNELKPVHEIAKQRARIFDIQDHAKKVQFEKMSRGRGGGMNMSRGRGGMNRGRGRGGGINRGRGGGMNRGRGGMNRGKRRG
ncbi:MAG: hypothetical protein EZS28_008925 [Streblomastix strix]|uniref:Uncharacterized protein n=1 Tax=Streblomastix strix TaxID=222440 RepID=A0A5J4WME2_9EUKA|nr:MAG: hypothetical protein EZS28_008925 [Streblomastix strix]